MSEENGLGMSLDVSNLGLEEFAKGGCLCWTSLLTLSSVQELGGGAFSGEPESVPKEITIPPGGCNAKH